MPTWTALYISAGNAAAVAAVTAAAVIGVFASKGKVISSVWMSPAGKGVLEDSGQDSVTEAAAA